MKNRSKFKEARHISQLVIDEYPSIRRYMVMTLASRKLIGMINENVCPARKLTQYSAQSDEADCIVACLYGVWGDHIRANTKWHCNLHLYELPHHLITGDKPMLKEGVLLASQPAYRDFMESKVLPHGSEFEEIYNVCINDRRFYEEFMDVVRAFERRDIEFSRARKKMRNLIVRAMERDRFTPEDTTLALFPVNYRDVVLNQLVDHYVSHYGLSSTRADLWDCEADKTYLLLIGAYGELQALRTGTTQPENVNSSEEITMNRNYDQPAIETVPFVYGIDARGLTDSAIAGTIADMEAEVKALEESKHPLQSTKDRVAAIKEHIDQLVKFADERYSKAQAAAGTGTVDDK